MKNSTRHLWILFLISLLAPPAGAGGEGGAVTGRVSDPEGLGLPGVYVYASSPVFQGERTAVSGADGVYELGSLPPGEYRVTFELERFSTQVRRFHLSLGQTETIDVPMQTAEVVKELITVPDCAPIPTSRWFHVDQLEEMAVRSAGSRVEALAGWSQGPKGFLTGQVSDTDGFTLPGATVTATSPALQGTRTTMSGADGEYRLGFLPPGQYQVSYELEGFVDSVRDLEISAGAEAVVDIELAFKAFSEDFVSKCCFPFPCPSKVKGVTADGLEALPVRGALSRIEQVSRDH